MFKKEDGICGIYKIENSANKKVYIGKSKNIKERWLSHLSELNKNKHGNSHLQNSFNKYGSDNFIFSVIEKCVTESLGEREYYWVDYYNSGNSDFGYNLQIPSTDGGYTTSKQTKDKLSEINIKYSEEELLNYIKRYYSENGTVPTRNDLDICDYAPNSKTYLHRFGTYRNAIEKSGLQNKLSGNSTQRRLKYSKEEVLNTIKEFIEDNDCYPITKDFDSNDNSLPSRNVVNRLFGNINNCMLELGYDDYKQKKKNKWSRDEIIERVNMYILEFGAFPKYNDFRYCEYLPSPNCVLNEFNSLIKMKELIYSKQ